MSIPDLTFRRRGKLRRGRAIRVALCVVAGLVGAVSLIGWISGSRHLGEAFHAVEPMRPANALTLTVAAAAVGLWGACGRRCRQFGGIGLAMVALTGAFHLFGVIDFLGPSGPLPAIVMVLVAIATPLATSKRAPLSLAGQWLGAAMLLIGMLVVIGYALRIAVLEQSQAYTPVAPSTAVMISLLGMAILYSNPRFGVGALLVDPSQLGSAVRWLMPVAILPPLLLGALAARSGQRLVGPQETAFWISFLSIAVISGFVARAIRAQRQAAWDRTVALQQSAASERMFRESFDSVYVGMAHITPDQRWVRLNDHLVSLVGRSREAIEKSTLTAFIDPAQQEDVERAFASVAQGESSAQERRIRIIQPGGAVVHADLWVARPGESRGGRGYLLVLVKDVTEATVSAERLRLSERAVDAVALGVVIADARQPDHPIVYVNPEFERITGYSREEILGRNCRFLNRQEPHQPGLNSVREALRRAKEVTVVLRNFRKDGTPFWNELSVSPVIDANGAVSHFVGIQDDVTQRMEDSGERERLLAEALDSRQSAEAAAKARERLLAVVSHELRSPLNAIRLWTSLLQSNPVVDQSTLQRALSQIHASVDSQSQLIADLLDATRFQSGDAQLDRRIMDWAELAQSVCEQSSAVASEKRVRLVYAGPDEAVTILGDAKRLRQVTRNMVDNALKFTAEGGTVVVALAVVGRQARLVVEDDGEGIEVDLLPRVFDEFWQADGRDARKHGGLGLGLHLVKHIVKQHGGQVSVHSDGLGKGSKFTVEIPIRTRLQNISSTAPTGQGGGSEVGKLLVVDDDAATAEALGLALRLRGHEVRVELSVDAAICAIEEFGPDVIISDLMMPGRTGFDFLRHVRETERADQSARVPALAISGRGGPEDRRRVRLAGFDHYVQKPVRVEALHDLVSRVLESPPAEHNCLRVLAAVADRQAGERLRDQLVAEGHEVFVAATSAEALLLAGNEPEVLVTVGNMGDGSHVDLAARLRQDSVSLVAIAMVEPGGLTERSEEVFDAEVVDVPELLGRLEMMRPSRPVPSRSSADRPTGSI